jgi:hypothetical protein
MKKIMTAVLIITVMVLLVGIKESSAGNNAVVMVSANILPRTSQTTLKQPTGLTVTRQDIAKGYLDVETGTVLRVTSNDNDGYYLNFRINAEFIRATDLMINGRSLSIQSGATLVHQPFPGMGGETIRISYRLFLSPEMKPGSYQWPVVVVAGLM